MSQDSPQETPAHEPDPTTTHRSRPTREERHALRQALRDDVKDVVAAHREEARDRAEMGGFGGPRERGRGGRGGRHGFGPGPGGRGRGRRGDIRAAILIALQDGPAHGYELIQSIEARSEGMWKPSPGSVYPTLQLLEEAGLLRSVEEGGKRVFSLTETGEAEANLRTAAAGDSMPWDRDGERGGHGELHSALGQLHMAAKQLRMVGTAEQVQRAADILTSARKQLYALLAED